MRTEKRGGMGADASRAAYANHAKKVGTDRDQEQNSPAEYAPAQGSLSGAASEEKLPRLLCVSKKVVHAEKGVDAR